MDICIIGTGMAGFGAAYRLQQQGIGTKPLMFDKNAYFGGHTASFDSGDGFIFDDGPHISFTKDERIQDLFAENIDGEYETVEAVVNNYWQGHWIKHPAQCNLNGLPKELVVNVIRDFVQAEEKTIDEIDNYKEWLYATYGETFAETFPMVYGKKFHTADAKDMDIDWLGPRMYRPKLTEVLEGALYNSTDDVHYIKDFRYPTNGGFSHYLEKFTDLADIHLNHEVVEIDSAQRRLTFSDGKAFNYDEIISSVPLPDLIKLIKDVPLGITNAAEKLACSQCILVNIGIDRNDFTDAIWTYFYDTDIIFTRLSFPHKMSPNTVPDGCGSIQAEIYFSDKYQPLDTTPEDCIEPVIADLKRVGLLKEEDTVLHKSSSFIPYANVIFDLDRAEAVEKTHAYLDEVGVPYCGRYGEWGYLWTDEAFKSGERAAQQVLDRNSISH